MREHFGKHGFGAICIAAMLVFAAGAIAADSSAPVVVTYLTGLSAGQVMGEDDRNLPAAMCYIIRPTQFGKDDKAVIFFPGVRGRGLPMKRESSYFANAGECMIPVAQRNAVDNSGHGSFAVLALELDPDDPAHAGKADVKTVETVASWGDALASSLTAVSVTGISLLSEAKGVATANVTVPIISEQADQARVAFKERLSREALIRQKYDHDFVGAALWIPQDDNERAVYLFGASADDAKSRGSVTARTKRVMPCDDIEWIEATIRSVTIHPASGKGERGDNKDVEVFIHSRFGLSLRDLTLAPGRYPKSKFKSVDWNEGTLKVGMPFWRSPSGDKRWKVPEGQAVPFIYLEATVWDADATDVEDPDDLLGILSHTVFADEIGTPDSKGIWEKKYKDKVGSRAMDTRGSKGWTLKPKLEMVGGGKVEIEYSLRVKFR